MDLINIEEELDSHTGFEVRILFNEIEKVAAAQQLADIEMHHFVI